MQAVVPQVLESTADGAGGKVESGKFELRFSSLFQPGRGLSFPCNASGEVDTESMSARAVANLQRARRQVGAEFATPQVIPSGG